VLSSVLQATFIGPRLFSLPLTVKVPRDMHNRDSRTSIPLRPRVLLVEDEATLREHLARALSDEYSVDTAGNGTEALRSVLKATPDLVVTDIVMPDVNGIELLRALRSTRRTQTVPVLLISGRARDEQRIEGFDEGADGYLAKPYTERELRSRIRSMLQGARLRDEMARSEAREQAEQRALAERAALLESITDAFYALDDAFRFTYLNQRALDYFGEPRESLLGKALWDVVPAENRAIFQQEYERAVRLQCSVAFEAGSPLSGRWVEVRAYPAAQGLAAYFRDVTDRKRAQEQLQEADRRKSEFLAVLAHELRNPLAALRYGLHIVERAAATEPTITSTLGMMDRQMTHLGRLVDDLLDLSRITRGKLELRRQKIQLAEVLERAVEASRTFIDARHHRLIIDLQAQNLLVDGDPDRLTQVFLNLLSNSAKYTKVGGRITVTLERDRVDALITVQDNGIGIPPAALEHVFDMFSQVRAEEVGTTDGLGIGLSLVRTLVQMHGGSVRASSDGPQRGSRFSVRLPLARGRADPRRTPRGPTARNPGQRVLVVDDNSDEAASLALLLEMEDCEVRTAADGEDAIEQARAFQPQIVFMDLLLARLDGAEAARRIRSLSEGERIRIVALTASAQEEDRQHSREAGMDSHLIKPVSLDVLKSVLGART
jgi:PAS domain S-box-containing protein